MTTKKLRSLLRKLRKFFPVDLPVVIRRRKMVNCGNALICNGTHYRINLNSKHCDITQKDTLLHEWPHLIVFMEEVSEPDHGKRWAYWYGKIYTAWEKDFA